MRGIGKSCKGSDQSRVCSRVRTNLPDKNFAPQMVLHKLWCIALQNTENGAVTLVLWHLFDDVRYNIAAFDLCGCKQFLRSKA